MIQIPNNQFDVPTGGFMFAGQGILTSVQAVHRRLEPPATN